MRTVWSVGVQLYGRYGVAMTMGGDAAELRPLARQMLGLSIWPTFDRSLARHSNPERSYLSAIHSCIEYTESYT